MSWSEWVQFTQVAAFVGAIAFALMKAGRLTGDVISSLKALETSFAEHTEEEKRRFAKIESAMDTGETRMEMIERTLEAIRTR